MNEKYHIVNMGSFTSSKDKSIVYYVVDILCIDSTKTHIERVFISKNLYQDFNERFDNEFDMFEFDISKYIKFTFVNGKYQLTIPVNEL